VKKLLISSVTILTLALIFSPHSADAQMGSMMNGQTSTPSLFSENEEHSQSIEIVLNELYSNQNVSTIQDLDCSKISMDDFERLGDAVMEELHPGEVHEEMDQMMGGEGSDSLEQMHVNMGSMYLGCSYRDNYNNYSRSMMGRNTSGDDRNQYYKSRSTGTGPGSMMNNYSYGLLGGYGYNILSTLTWLALIIFLSSGTYFFIKQSRKK